MTNFKLIMNQLKWNMIGNVVFGISQWLIIVFITKFGNIEDLGDYTYALAIISPIILFFSFDLRRVLATSQEDKFYSYFTNRIIHLLIGIFIIMSVCYLISDNRVWYLTFALCTYKFFEYISDIIFGYYQQLNDIERVGISQFFRGILNIVFFGVTYVLTNNLLMSIFAMNISMIIILIKNDLKNINLDLNKLFESINKKSFIEIIKDNLSLSFSLLIVSLIVNIPKLYLEHFQTAKELAYFSGIYYIITIVNLVTNPILIILSNRFKHAYSKSLEYLKLVVYKILIYSSIFSSLIIVLLIICSKDILILLYNPEFTNYYLSFNILLISIIFSVQNGILGLSLITIRKNRQQLVINLLNFIISLVVGGLLIYFFSVLGAALTILVNRILALICLFSTLRQSKV